MAAPLREARIDFPAAVKVPAVQVRGAENMQVSETVAAEVPVAFAFNGADHLVMLATPADLDDFAYGFCLTEGIIERRDEIAAVAAHELGTGLRLDIRIPETRAAALKDRARHLAGRTGCGLCGISSIEQVLRSLPDIEAPVPFPAAAIAAAQAALGERQALNRVTGAVHAAAFADHAGTLLYVREDVGRHNALDKLIGALTRAGVDPASGFALVTSRLSLEMAQKTIAAKIPLLAAISAPTSLAIALAKAAGLTLAAFVREKGFTLYTHADRVKLP